MGKHTPTLIDETQPEDGFTRFERMVSQAMQGAYGPLEKTTRRERLGSWLATRIIDNSHIYPLLAMVSVALFGFGEAFLFQADKHPWYYLAWIPVAVALVIQPGLALNAIFLTERKHRRVNAEMNLIKEVLRMRAQPQRFSDSAIDEYLDHMHSMIKRDSRIW